MGKAYDTAVPPANSVANTSTREVVGNKTDRRQDGGTSLYAYLYTLYDYVHQRAQVRPDLADAVTVTAGDTEWTYGALSGDIIAAAAEANDLDIHWVFVAEPSANTQYQLALVAGDSTVIGEIAFERLNVTVRSFEVPIQIPVQPAGTRIRAKLATKAGGEETIRIKVYLHQYA